MLRCSYYYQVIGPPAHRAEPSLTPTLVMFIQAQNVIAIFDFFSSGSVFVILCLLLPELELLSLLLSPLTVGNSAILFHKCNQLHENPSCCPSSRLAFLSSLFDPLCASLCLWWHLTRLTCVTVVSSPVRLDFLRTSTVC